MYSKIYLRLEPLGLELVAAAAERAGHSVRGQTNFLRMIWKFNSVYRPDLQVADHQQPIKYEIDLPPPSTATVERDDLYIHTSSGRKGRQIDPHTEEFVNATRMGSAA
jgi:hypothetical protein